MIYGKPPVHIADDKTDFIGIRTLLLHQMWEPSREGISQLQIDEEKPPVPAVPGGLLLIGEQTRQQGGAMRTLWTFEGMAGDGSSVTFKDRSQSLDYGFDPGFAEIDIRQHPDVLSLVEAYGGYPDPSSQELLWPPSIQTSAGSAGIGLVGGSQQKQETNPLYGHSSFYKMDGTYRFRYASLVMPSFAGIGRIHSSGQLPGQPPPVSEGRNWLKMAPQPRRRGLIFEVIETYWLSLPDGWPAPLYGSHSANPDDDTSPSINPGSGLLSSGGLTTGSL